MNRQIGYLKRKRHVRNVAFTIQCKHWNKDGKLSVVSELRRNTHKVKITTQK